MGILWRGALNENLQTLFWQIRHLPKDKTFQRIVQLANEMQDFRAATIFLVGHFITTPTLYENLEKYPPSANSTFP